MNIDLLIVELKEQHVMEDGVVINVEVNIPIKSGLSIVLIVIMIYVVNAQKKKI